MRTLLENLREDEAGVSRDIKVAGRYLSNDIGQAIAEIERLKKLCEWRDFKTDPPKSSDGVIIYRKARNHDGRWPVGVAYLNVSGKWSDSSSFDPQEIMFWMPLPEAAL